MTKERIRILVDTSRDTGWSDGLIRIEPDSIYQTTNNRDYLSEAVLKNYDVLTICSNTPLKYTDAELELIREFVENGGGLLLASSTSRFERDVCEPISNWGLITSHLFSVRGFFSYPKDKEKWMPTRIRCAGIQRKICASLTPKLLMDWELMTWGSRIAAS